MGCYQHMHACAHNAPKNLYACTHIRDFRLDVGACMYVCMYRYSIQRMDMGHSHVSLECAYTRAHIHMYRACIHTYKHTYRIQRVNFDPRKLIPHLRHLVFLSMHLFLHTLSALIRTLRRFLQRCLLRERRQNLNLQFLSLVSRGCDSPVNFVCLVFNEFLLLLYAQ